MPGTPTPCSCHAPVSRPGWRARRGRRRTRRSRPSAGSTPSTSGSGTTEHRVSGCDGHNILLFINIFQAARVTLSSTTVPHTQGTVREIIRIISYIQVRGECGVDTACGVPAVGRDGGLGAALPHQQPRLRQHPAGHVPQTLPGRPHIQVGAYSCSILSFYIDFKITLHYYLGPTCRCGGRPAAGRRWPRQSSSTIPHIRAAGDTFCGHK